jgi:urease accessory protein UreE
MTCERVIGKVDETANVDWAEIDWKQTVRRALRLRTRSGRAINVLLPRHHPPLRHGDLLCMVDAIPVAIFVRPSRLLRIEVKDASTMGRLCAELGNLHVPLEVDGYVVLTLEDGPVCEVIDRYGLRGIASVGRFHPLRFTVTSPLPGQQ